VDRREVGRGQSGRKGSGSRRAISGDRMVGEVNRGQESK
jgi:hypothetical protein